MSNNQEEGSNQKNKSISFDEKQAQYDKFKAVFESFIDRIDFKVDDLFNEIKELAERMEEEKVVPKHMICGTIKFFIRKLKEEKKDLKVKVSDDMIERALDEGYKDPTKIRDRKPRPQEIPNDDNKVKEESPILTATTSGNTVSEPEVNPQPQSNTTPLTPEEEMLLDQSVAEQQAAKIEEPVIALAKSLESENKTLKEKIKVLEQEKENVIKVKNEVLQKAAPNKSFVRRTNIPLQIDDKQEFEQNIELNKAYASWIAEKIREFIVKYPKLDYFLIQTGNGKIRINIPKTDFLT